MTMEEIKKVAVVGAGAMGRQIGMNTAIHGYEVTICDIAPQVLADAQKWAKEYLAGRVAKGRMTQEKVDSIAKALHFSGDIDAGVREASLVIEAVVENLEIKQKVFAQISAACRSDAILATNSSNLVSSKLAPVVSHPERLMNMHFFNPALVMKLVEVVQGPHTSLENVKTAMAFVERTGKTPIHIKKEIAGFVANRINAAVNREACILLAKGIAGVEEIDLACENGLGYPMGPFRLMDLTGIDVNYYVRRDRFAESGDEFDRPHPLIVEKFEKGEFGRKTGKGWYEYPEKK